MNRFHRRLAVGAVVLWTAAAGAGDALAQAEASAGYDLFATDPAQTDLLGIAFEGDAGVRPTFDFVPPPDSADGRRAIGDSDTIVHRLESASVASVPGTAAPIAIEVVLLRLVSRDTFDLDGDGRQERLYVTLQKDRSPAGETRLDYDVPPPGEGEPVPPLGPIEEEVQPGPRSFGDMTITFASDDGGTFDSRLTIFADLRLGEPDGPIVCGESAGLPPCSDFDGGLILESEGATWGRQATPESITIRGVNFSLAAPDRSEPVDTRLDFWAGIDPTVGETVCVEHGGHPDPGGLPTQHNTCATPCSKAALALSSCRNGRDDDCNGTIDDCDEDGFGPSVTAPAGVVFECPRTNAEVAPAVTGFATATDNCFPLAVPAASIAYEDFRTDRCGGTFLLDRIWTAADDCGNPASMPDLQQIEVVDTTAPEITFCPVAATILWTVDPTPDLLGTAAGEDACGGVGIAFDDVSVAGVCRSAEITRTWTATDECGLATPCTQPISVRGPKDAVEDLQADVAGLGLSGGLENALSATLDNAVDAVCGGRATPAVNQLEAFVHQVEALSRNQLDPADAARLIAAAEAIIAAVEDPANGGACPEGCEGVDEGGGDDDGGDDDGGDDGDACPDSDTSRTIVIDGCATGVENFAFGDGCTAADRIGECAESAGNHGQFERCVRDLIGELKAAGAISGNDGGAIQRCAGQADLP